MGKGENYIVSVLNSSLEFNVDTNCLRASAGAAINIQFLIQHSACVRQSLPL